ncbi:Hypothetical predicted protein [Paramuricea clavata]|uniref:Uncharacterized protein n=1 Tax=Paramuricea clavata TaxID=317549 RepID=A0A7D9L7K1_PARCT|nr:Hypothetical predicted protein [Paramuricea clavata]
MCSIKNPSLLRKTSKKDILNFSLSKFDEEAKQRIPLLQSVLMSASATLCRLRINRLAVSHTYLYKKLDEYGKNHHQNILTQVAKDRERMKEMKLHKDGNPSAVPATCQARETARKIVFDTFDFKQLVHHMTEDHQSIDNHWVTHVSVENRVSGNQQKNQKQRACLKIENAKLLPNKIEHILQRDNYSSLVSRILVDNIPCLDFLNECASRHIKHAYTSEMMKKTENEYPISQGLAGDQLSVERGANQLQVANGLTPQERNEGLHLEIADFHAQMKFVQVAFDHFYDPGAAVDKCTLFADKVLIDRRNVVQEVKKNFTLNLLGLQSLLEGIPDESALPAAMKEASLQTRKAFLKDLCFQVVDKFVLQEDEMNQLISKLEKEKEDVGMLPNGRFPCRYPSCKKSFARDDAVSEGDGQRIIRCWKFFLMFLKGDAQRSSSMH